jgi:hypothetical protein
MKATDRNEQAPACSGSLSLVFEWRTPTRSRIGVSIDILSLTNPASLQVLNGQVSSTPPTPGDFYHLQCGDPHSKLYGQQHGLSVEGPTAS